MWRIATPQIHNQQSRRIWEIPLNKTIPYSNLKSQNWTEIYEEIKYYQIQPKSS